VRQLEPANARCAASIALSTSCAVLLATSAVTCSVSGLISGKYAPDALGTNLPAMNCSQRRKLLVFG